MRVLDGIIIIGIYIIAYLVGWVSCDLYRRNKLIQEQRDEILRTFKQQDNGTKKNGEESSN